MIRKPANDWRRESASVMHLRSAATGGVAVAKAGTYYLRGLVMWGFALLWGYAALAGGVLGGSLPTLIGVGAMAAGMAWGGNRMFKKARGRDAGVSSAATAEDRARHARTLRTFHATDIRG